MVKKKAKSKRTSKNDNRGYSITATVAAPIKQKDSDNASYEEVPLIIQTPDKIPQDPQPTIVSCDTTATTTTTTTPVIEVTRSKQFLQKVIKIYDTLDYHGFRDEQIRRAVHALGAAVTIETAVDWLCVNENVEDLPALFIDVEEAIAVREAASTTTVEVVTKPTRKTESEKIERTFAVEDEPHRAARVKIPGEHSSEKNNLKKTSSTGRTQKDWILQQYAYEQEEGGDIDVEGLCNVAQESTITCAATYDSESVKMTSTESITQIPEEVELEKLNLKLEEMKMDINDEASNYMRSKYEIKEMKNAIKQVESQRNKLKGQINKMKKKMALNLDPTTNPDVIASQDASVPPINMRSNTVPSDEEIRKEEQYLEQINMKLEEMKRDANDDVANYTRSKHELSELNKEIKQMWIKKKKVSGQLQKKKKLLAVQEEKTHSDRKELPDDPNTIITKGERGMSTLEEAIESKVDVNIGGSILSMFEESEDTLSLGTKKDVVVEELPVIPKDWSGKTPVKLLEEYCQKQNIPKPRYEKLDCGCRVRVNSPNNNNITLEKYGTSGNKKSWKDAQQYLATEALYKLDSNLPLYRLMPPVFRDIWKSWMKTKKNEEEDKRQNEINQKVSKIQSIIDSIPMGTRDDGVNVHGVIPNDTNDGLMKDKFAKKEYKMKSSNDGSRIRRDYEKQQQTEKYQHMLSQRKLLPMYSHRDEILDTISKNPVTVLCGETGCGKTTQCPQYILEQAIYDYRGDDVSILCTQPRRVAALSVAERVAEEFGLGCLGDTIGYNIRMDAKKSSRTRLLFCTTGVVLRRLQDDPNLSGVTHIVVDEVHERQWEIDFLLVALRKLLRTTRTDLKVVLMSATLDTTLFCDFFGAPLLSVPGRTFPVSNYYLEDLLDATNHVIEEGSDCAIRKHYSSKNENATLHITGKGGTQRKEVVSLESQYAPISVSDKYQGYKMSTRRSMERVDEQRINYDLIEDVLNLLLLHPDQNDTILPPVVVDTEKTDKHFFESGAVLIFLPGLGEIRVLSERLQGSRSFNNKSKFDIIQMHSTLAPADQRRAFLPCKIGCRKIILSTNIAETSVTIPDVVFVIDSGLAREVRQNERTSTSTLVTDWCSRASAKQRSGRAGRVRPGISCKLYSSYTANHVMKKNSTPELQRVPLEEICLAVLAGKLSSNCIEFLLQAPQPPSNEAVEKALLRLEEVGAIELHEDKEYLTQMGIYLSKIPVDVKLGKLLIFGSLFKCIDRALTIAAVLSCKSPFANYVDVAQQATAAHRTFKHPTSDFLSLCNVWDAYLEASSISVSEARKFCKKFYLNRTALIEINTSRRQFLDLLHQLGFLAQLDRKISESTYKNLATSYYNQNGKNDELINVLICAGLYPNIVRCVQPESSSINEMPCYYHKNERVYLHNSSVNSKKKDLEWICFHEKFATSKSYISVTDLVKPFSLMLFGKSIVVKHFDRKVIIDNWIELNIDAKTGVIFRNLRKELESILMNLLSNTNNIAQGNKEIENIIQLITADKVYSNNCSNFKLQ